MVYMNMYVYLSYWEILLLVFNSYSSEQYI